MTKKLPIQIILKEAILLPFQNFFILLPYLIPLLIVTILSDIYHIETSKDLSVIFSFTTLQSIVSIIAIVALHKVFILGKSSLNVKKHISASMNYFGWWVFIFILFIILVIILVLLHNSDIINLSDIKKDNITLYIGIGYLVLSYFVARFLLVLPASAIGMKNNTLKNAWIISKGNSFQLFFLLSVIPFITSLLISYIHISDSIIYLMIVKIIWLSIWAIEIAILSLSFNFLRETNDEQ